MGAWAAANPTAVEETAQKLRDAYERYLKKEDGYPEWTLHF
jgi:UDPglucose--hexose-1-phosphate uridylyltransferase